MHVTAIIAAGGRGARFGASEPKQLLMLGGVPILERSVGAFLRSSRVDEVIVALPAQLIADPPPYLARANHRIVLVEGGLRRQDSVANAFRQMASQTDIVVIHDAARPLVSEALIARTIDAAAASGAAIAALAATDTVKRGTANGVIVGTLPRGEVFMAQTPQAFRVGVLRDALAVASTQADATDEAMLAEQAGHPVVLVEGERTNIKITTLDDLEMAQRLIGSDAPRLRIGNGYDLHRLVVGRPLVLAGVTIPFEKGLDGHSDADAVCHAVTDAVLGATSRGDIGRMFPDSDPEWKGANSLQLLTRAMASVRAAGFAVSNVDVVVIAQRPRLVPYVDAMRSNLAGALAVDLDCVSVKGKTNEGVDAMGTGDAIAVHAVVLVVQGAV